MDLGEIIAPPVAHTKPNEKCPFCPPPAPVEYTTHAGEKNDSKKLASIMKSPSQLVPLQSGARPQTAKVGPNGYVQEQQKLEPRLEDETKFYTHQAHHLISGNQALKKSPMEKWILASEANEKDTGYSVNSTGNGFWAPSVPKELVGKWGPGKGLSNPQRQEWAEKVMKSANAQAHIGPHNISDPDDPSGDKHQSYDKYIKAKLIAISDRVKAWSDECYQCKDAKKSNKKPQATYAVHDVLDRLSNHLQTQITGSRSNWKIFLSKYSLAYHTPVCTHCRERS
ncbi:MAG: hypothetical protein EOO52_08595 [Gammaproteobacteria bacterium]|nr:MAG: hypothetical protein EOO52_08595 [Gammaproteobacteria bacterium]